MAIGDRARGGYQWSTTSLISFSQLRERRALPPPPKGPPKPRLFLPPSTALATPVWSPAAVLSVAAPPAPLVSAWFSPPQTHQQPAASPWGPGLAQSAPSLPPPVALSFATTPFFSLQAPIVWLPASVVSPAPAPPPISLSSVAAPRTGPLTLPPPVATNAAAPTSPAPVVSTVWRTSGGVVWAPRLVAQPTVAPPLAAPSFSFTPASTSGAVVVLFDAVWYFTEFAGVSALFTPSASISPITQLAGITVYSQSASIPGPIVQSGVISTFTAYGECVSGF